MVQLKFSNSNIGCYQIVEASNKKRYVIDSSSINSKGTVWGFWPETITVTGYEIDKNNVQFDVRQKPLDRPMTSLVIAMQPISAGLYFLLKNTFITLGVSQQWFLKLPLYLFTMIFAFIFVKISLSRSQKKAMRKIGLNLSKCTFIFKPKSKRDYTGYICFGMNAILFFIFLYLNDGAEVIILILNGIIALLSFMLTTSAIPVGYYVNSGMIELVEIREG